MADEERPLQFFLNTVQLFFGPYHEQEVVKAVFDADNGMRDFSLISDILWELLPEDVRARYGFRKKEFLMDRWQEDFDMVKLGLTKEKVVEVAKEVLPKSLARVQCTMEDYTDPDRRKLFYHKYGLLAVLNAVVEEVARGAGAEPLAVGQPRPSESGSLSEPATEHGEQWGQAQPEWVSWETYCRLQSKLERAKVQFFEMKAAHHRSKDANRELKQQLAASRAQERVEDQLVELQLVLRQSSLGAGQGVSPSGAADSVGSADLERADVASLQQQLDAAHAQLAEAQAAAAAELSRVREVAAQDMAAVRDEAAAAHADAKAAMTAELETARTTVVQLEEELEELRATFAAGGGGMSGTAAAPGWGWEDDEDQPAAVSEARAQQQLLEQEAAELRNQLEEARLTALELQQQEQLVEAEQAKEEAERQLASSQRRLQAELQAAVARTKEAEVEVHMLQQRAAHRSAGGAASMHVAVQCEPMDASEQQQLDVPCSPISPVPAPAVAAGAAGDDGGTREAESGSTPDAAAVSKLRAVAQKQKAKIQSQKEEIAALKDQSREAADWEQIAVELMDKATSLQQELMTLTEQLAQRDRDLAQQCSQDLLQQLRQENEDLLVRLETAEAVLAASGEPGSYLVALQHQLIDAQARLQALMDQLAVRSEQLAAKEEELAAFIEQQQQADAEIAELGAQVDQIRENNLRVQQAVADRHAQELAAAQSQGQLAAAKEQLAAAHSPGPAIPGDADSTAAINTTADLHQQLNKLQEEYAAAQAAASAQFSELKAQLAAAELLADERHREASALRAQLQQDCQAAVLACEHAQELMARQASLENTHQLLAAAQAELSIMQGVLTCKDDQIAAMQEDLGALHRLDELQQQAIESQAQVDSLEQQLEDKLAELEDLQSQAAAHESEALQGEAVDLQHQVDQHRATVVQLRQQVEALKEQLLEAQQRPADMSAASEDDATVAGSSAADSAVAALQAELASTQQALAAARFVAAEVHAALQAKVDKAREQFAKLKAANAANQAKASALELQLLEMKLTELLAAREAELLNEAEAGTQLQAQLSQLQAEVVAKQAMMSTLCDQLTAAQQQLTELDSHSAGALEALQQQLADSAGASNLLKQQLAEAEAAKAGLQQQLLALEEHLHSTAQEDGQATLQQLEATESSHLGLLSNSPGRANSTDPAGSRAQLAVQVSELAAHISALEEERSAAATTISSLRQELADRQLALSAAQDAANEAVQRVEQLSKELWDIREATQVQSDLQPVALQQQQQAEPSGDLGPDFEILQQVAALQQQAHEALLQQLESTVSEAVAAAQAHFGTVVEARDAALAAAEADVDELRRALGGRDEQLLQLEAKLAAPTAAAGAPDSAVSTPLGSKDQQQPASKLETEIVGLRRELAAAHQRTHEVTQMYLTAVNSKPSAAPESALHSAASSSETWQALVVNPARGRTSPPFLAPKGLVGLYKRPK
eukprot:gene8156-8349_t